MHEQKKSAVTVPSVSDASKNTLHINDSTDTEEMQEFFKLTRTLEPKHWALLLSEEHKMVKCNRIQRASCKEVGAMHD